MTESPLMPDEELLHRARHGDHNAFHLLVHRHDQHIFSIVARYAGTAEDAKDLYQEVFLRVWKGLPHFRFQSEFRTWVHRIAVNVCLSFRSKQAALPSRVNGPQGEPDDRYEPADSGALPDAQAMNAELSRSVQRAIDHLSPRQRMAFVLRHHEGYRIREIAVMMNCREGTVKRYLFTATERMRNELKEYL